MKLKGLIGYQTTTAYETNLTLNRTYFNESSNETIPVQLCYIKQTAENQDNYQSFLDECKNRKLKDNTTVNAIWVLVSNTNDDRDENIVVLNKASNQTDSHMHGLIMI